MNLFELAIVGVSFAVGHAMKAGGLCTYAAARQILRERRLERLFAFLGAAAFAALAVLPLAWLWPQDVRLSATHEVWGAVLVGGLLLGTGAWLNRGCFFGTFVQITGGNLTYLATLPGIVLGALAASAWLPAALRPAPATAPLAAMPDAAGLGWLALAVLFLSLLLVDMRRLRWRAGVARGVMLVLGIGGGLLFATVSGWDLAAVLVRRTQAAFGLGAGPSWLAIWCTLAMTAGGIVAAVRLGRFRWRAPRLLPMLASFGGGALMGAAAIILPGGNDGLLLSGLPALAPHALVGFALMLAAMLALLAWLPNDADYRQPRG